MVQFSDKKRDVNGKGLFFFLDFFCWKRAFSKRLDSVLYFEKNVQCFGMEYLGDFPASDMLLFPSASLLCMTWT